MDHHDRPDDRSPANASTMRTPLTGIVTSAAYIMQRKKSSRIVAGDTERKPYSALARRGELVDALVVRYRLVP
jgi:hypothetical protein